MKIPVLDHGYVSLINNMGTDVDVVNSARVSYDKEVEFLSDNDERLLEFLVKNKHDSTLRHCVLTFEVYAPLMIARQWYKHAVASTHLDDQMGWNESSRRYVTEEPVFYQPRTFLQAAENKKQGSSGPIKPMTSEFLASRLQTLQDECLNVYKNALALGVAPEQARLFLPAYGLYVRWRWTVSLNAVLHFLALRNENDAQSEIQEYANAVEHFVSELYPLTTGYWRKHR